MAFTVDQRLAPGVLVRLSGLGRASVLSSSDSDFDGTEAITLQDALDINAVITYDDTASYEEGDLVLGRTSTAGEFHTSSGANTPFLFVATQDIDAATDTDRDPSAAQNNKWVRVGGSAVDVVRYNSTTMMDEEEQYAFGDRLADRTYVDQQDTELNTRLTVTESQIGTTYDDPGMAGFQSIDTRLDHIESHIGSGSGMGSADSRVDGMQDILVGSGNVLADYTDTDSVSTRLDDAESGIATNAANISTNAADIATNVTNIATNTADISELDTNATRLWKTSTFVDPTNPNNLTISSSNPVVLQPGDGFYRDHLSSPGPAYYNTSSNPVNIEQVSSSYLATVAGLSASPNLPPAIAGNSPAGDYVLRVDPGTNANFLDSAVWTRLTETEQVINFYDFTGIDTSDPLYDTAQPDVTVHPGDYVLLPVQDTGAVSQDVGNVGTFIAELFLKLGDEVTLPKSDPTIVRPDPYSGTRTVDQDWLHITTYEDVSVSIDFMTPTVVHVLSEQNNRTVDIVLTVANGSFENTGATVSVDGDSVAYDSATDGALSSAGTVLTLSDLVIPASVVTTSGIKTFTFEDLSVTSFEGARNTSFTVMFNFEVMDDRSITVQTQQSGANVDSVDLATNTDPVSIVVVNQEQLVDTGSVAADMFDYTYNNAPPNSDPNLADDILPVDDILEGTFVYEAAYTDTRRGTNTDIEGTGELTGYLPLVYGLNSSTSTPPALSSTTSVTTETVQADMDYELPTIAVGSNTVLWVGVPADSASPAHEGQIITSIFIGALSVTVPSFRLARADSDYEYNMYPITGLVADTYIHELTIRTGDET